MKRKLTRKKINLTDDLKSLRQEKMSLREVRNELRRKILKDKEDAWKKLCDKVNDEL